MTRRRTIQIYSLCIISMVVLGAFTDKVIVSVASCLEKMALESDPHAFATGKTDTFAGWAYAF